MAASLGVSAVQCSAVQGSEELVGELENCSSVVVSCCY
jgi:hypothetical protein